MSDKELMIISTLEDIKFSIELILKRFKAIDSSDDFLADETGLEKLDGISMRLVAIGEGFPRSHRFCVGMHTRATIKQKE